MERSILYRAAENYNILPKHFFPTTLKVTVDKKQQQFQFAVCSKLHHRHRKPVEEGALVGWDDLFFVEC